MQSTRTTVASAVTEPSHHDRRMAKLDDYDMSSDIDGTGAHSVHTVEHVTRTDAPMQTPDRTRPFLCLQIQMNRPPGKPAANLVLPPATKPARPHTWAPPTNQVPATSLRERRGTAPQGRSLSVLHARPPSVHLAALAKCTQCALQGASQALATLSGAGAPRRARSEKIPWASVRCLRSRNMRSMEKRRVVASPSSTLQAKAAV